MEEVWRRMRAGEEPLKAWVIHILQVTGCLRGIFLFNQFCIFVKISDQLSRFSAVMFL